MRHRAVTLLCAAALLAAGCDGQAPREDRGPQDAVETPTTTVETPARAVETPTTAPDAPPTRPAPGAPRTADEDDPNVARFAGFEAPKPAVWLWQPPQSRMRAANYVVPGRDGANQAHLVVFAGIRGGVEANIERWAGQFRTPDEAPASPIVTKLDVNDVPVTVVELRGEYMAMGQNWYTPDQVFLAAIVEAPEGELFIRLVGETATVEANREAFMTLVHGLRRAD